MRLIDVDKLPFEKMEISATSEEWCVRLSDIESAPTVDAVEVVRCCECRHFCRHFRYKHTPDGYLPEGVVETECKLFCCGMDYTDFCSYGERKEDA